MNHRRFALALALASASMAAFPQTAAASSFTLEGSAQSLTIVAEDASRSEIVAAIVERFSLQEEGGGVEEGPVSGRFSGTLGQVLKSILPSEGYAISYRDGQPSKLTFAGPNGLGAAGGEVTSSGAAAPSEASVRQRETTPEAQISGMLQRRTYEQVLAAKPSFPEPEAAGQAKSTQQEIAEATARAVKQLEALTRGLNGRGETNQ